MSGFLTSSKANLCKCTHSIWGTHDKRIIDNNNVQNIHDKDSEGNTLLDSARRNRVECGIKR